MVKTFERKKQCLKTLLEFLYQSQIKQCARLLS